MTPDEEQDIMLRAIAAAAAEDGVTAKAALTELVERSDDVFRTLLSGACGLAAIILRGHEGEIMLREGVPLQVEILDGARLEPAGPGTPEGIQVAAALIAAVANDDAEGAGHLFAAAGPRVAVDAVWDLLGMAAAFVRADYDERTD